MQAVYENKQPVFFNRNLLYICSMIYKIPKDELYRYSFKFSLFIMLIAFVSIYVMENNLEIIVFRSIMAFIHFYVCFLINIFLYKILSKKSEEVNERIKAFYGVLLTIVVLIITTYSTQYLMNIGWLPKKLNDARTVQVFTSWRAFFYIPFLAVVIFSIVHFFHRFVILAHATKQSELEVSRLQITNAETLNQLLKQQIQPHFLFNALNTLKSLIKKQPATAENYLMQLSDFLRASISGYRSDTVSVKEELDLCTNYMEMQKVRFGEALKYEVDVPDSYLHQFYVPFFSLQPLLENAIKHNELTKEKALTIHLYVENESIIVKNNLQKRKQVDSSTGNGLKNLNERYKILHNSDIEINETDKDFIVRIKLIPHENSNH